MSVTTRPDDAVYAAFNAADESQIINSEKYLVSGEWLYEVHGQYSISYDGIRAFAKWLANHGIIVQTISSEITESGDGQSLKYMAKVKVKDAVTGVVFEGISSQMQYGEKKDGSRYLDSTAETKAHSKAERNGIRKHVPSDLITKFIKEVQKDGRVKTLNVDDAAPGKPDSKSNKTKVASDIDWCKCNSPRVRFSKENSGKYEGCHTCVTCDLPVRDAESHLKGGATPS